MIIAIVAAALIAMRIYTVRGFQEKYRQSADVFGQGEQFAKSTIQTYSNSSFDIPVDPPDPHDPCPGVVANVDNLTAEIADLREDAATLLASAAAAEAALPEILAQAESFASQAKTREDAAAADRKLAAEEIASAIEKEAEAAKNREDYPYCFTGGCVYSCAEEDSCCCIVDNTAMLEAKSVELRADAAKQIADAEVLEAAARDLRRKEADLRSSIATLETQIADLRKQAADKTTSADAKEAKVAQYEEDYPECF